MQQNSNRFDLVGLTKSYWHRNAVSVFQRIQIACQGDHQENAGYGAGYGPLQCSHQGNHHVIAKKFGVTPQNGPIQEEKNSFENGMANGF